MRKETTYLRGDLVKARYGYAKDSPHWEWNAGLDFPEEYAVIISVVKTGYDNFKYYVKFIDGTEDCMWVNEMRLIALGGDDAEKIPRHSASPNRGN
jgi:hypothetical protein